MPRSRSVATIARSRKHWQPRGKHNAVRAQGILGLGAVEQMKDGTTEARFHRGKATEPTFTFTCVTADDAFEVVDALFYRERLGLQTVLRLAIYEVDHGKRGPLIATVSDQGEVTPDDETTAGIKQYVQRMVEQLGLTGTALLHRLERSYTNGYVMARIVE